MPWQLTDSLEDFTAATDQYLRSDPVRNTVPLTVLETLREAGPTAFGDATPVFGWHQSVSGAADGAFLQTPPHPLLLTSLPDGSARDLIELLADRHLRAANVTTEDAAEFRHAWTQVTRGRTELDMRMRLYRLAQLTPPDPPPSGAARVARKSDYDLLVAWNNEFRGETGTGGEDADWVVTDKLSHGGMIVWEDGGRPVAMASMTRSVAGVCRIASVYTPPEHRRHGYGGGATTAVSQQALAAGAAAVVLFTDLANPTSNALYLRLGFRPVADRTALDLL
jgi:predicted GNAT family acetyltransferase